jgi:chromate transporter
MDQRPVATSKPRDLVPFGEAVRAWFLISLQTFGGPAGQIAVMQRTLVDEKRWIGQQRFLHALNYCMLLPGPEAQQLAVYVGWLLNGTRGGIAAGGLFVLPGVVALLALSAIYVAYGDTGIVTWVFAGLAPAVVGIVIQAVVRVGRRALHQPAHRAMAAAAFVALALFAVPYPIVILAAGLAGWVIGRADPSTMAPAAPSGTGDAAPPPLVSDHDLHSERPSAARTLRVLAIGLLLWAAPVVLVVAVLGTSSVLLQQGLFFSGTAVVTFGGAYAVLAFVAQRAVASYGWLGPGEMAKGLALAETTPGPLVMVVQFVAFLGAYRNPGHLDPWLAAVLGALLTSWVTFVPSFLFIFLGAPYVERLRGNRTLSAALAGVTAAVVGVIANLAFYFGVHTLFRDVRTLSLGPLHVQYALFGSLRPAAVAITVIACLLLFRLRWSVLRALGASAVLGAAAGLLGLV